MTIRRLSILPLAAFLLYVVGVSFATTRGSLGHSLIKALESNSTEASAGPELVDAVHRYLSVRPLAEDGYFALALTVERTGDLDRAERLARRAIRLEPRLASAHFWLASRYLTTGRIEAGIGEIEVLLRLERELGPALTVLLVEVARHPEGRDVVARRLAGTPQILETLRHGAQAGLSPAELLDLVRPTDLAHLDDGVETAQTVIAGALLERELYGQARATWYRLGGQRPSGAVFDGNFRGLIGAPPFGWTLLSGPEIQARMVGGAAPGGRGALEVEAFGSLPGRIAEQTVLLAPGTYQLRFLVSGPSNSSQNESRFFWTVTCVSGVLLTEEFIESPFVTWSRRSHAFTVPRGCPVQKLSLQKASTATGRGHGIRISGVELVAAAG